MQEQEIYVLFCERESRIWVCQEIDGKYKASEAVLSDRTKKIGEVLERDCTRSARSRIKGSRTGTFIKAFN